jgi:hypothetical protein
MELIEKWFNAFKEENQDKEKFISNIQKNISSSGFNETKFNDIIEKELKSISERIIAEKLNPIDDENS